MIEYRNYGFVPPPQKKTKLQEELGADLDVDISYQLLWFFLKDDDELARIGRESGNGKWEYWSTGAVKARLVEILKEIVSKHLEI